MPRTKAPARKRTSGDQNESAPGSPIPGPATKTPRRSSPASLTRRILVPGPGPAPIPLLGPVCLPWSVPEHLGPPSRLLCCHDASGQPQVTADDQPVVTTPELVDLLFKPNQLLFFSASTSTELILDIGLRVFPKLNARALVESIYSKDYSAYEQDTELADTDWASFFKEVETVQASRSPPEGNFQHPDLRPTLRAYQAAAVAWMVEREDAPVKLSLEWLPDVADRFTTRDDRTVLYNKYCSVLSANIESTFICSGGILADEMGLGKTVITLALLLNHTRSDLGTAWKMLKPSSVEDVDMDDGSGDNSRHQEREKNLETCLNADEKLQLVPSKPGVGLLRSTLTAWYESKLAEVSVNRSSRARRSRQRHQFKCTCSGVADDALGKAVTCECCGLMQHASCGGHKGNLVYICPACWRQQEPVPSKATLIVAPPAIVVQWENEVKKHAPTMKVLVYRGVRDKFVQPTYMALFDVVITSYSTFRAETLYITEESARRLRNEGRFLRSSGALERVSWWRVVCDEAQMVESNGSQIRVMTQRLTAAHRWSVTGTPIQRGVADLFYLTSFMGLGAFDNKDIWTNFLLKPYLAGCKKPLLSLLTQVFWRSTKEEVSADLALPEQTFQLHLLKFSAIEETFYMQQHALSASKFAEGLRKSRFPLETTLDSLDKVALKRILQPLLNLRQACTHAQVVSGICVTSNTTGAANQAQLLHYLVKNVKIACEEALRRHVAALNGLAGLHCLVTSWGEAIENYRAVLRLAEECPGGVQVDTLQRIHSLTNAAGVLKDQPGCAPPTLRDDQLLQDAAQLEKKYLSKPEEAFKASLEQAEASKKEVQAIRLNFETAPDAWWVPIPLRLSKKDQEDDLVAKLTEELHSNDPTEKLAAKQFLTKVSSIRGIEITIRQWWKDLEKHYKAACAAMDGLVATPCSDLVGQALACHLRVAIAEHGARCQLCTVERALQDLECELFATTRKSVQKREKVLDGAETKGSWKAHSAERTLFSMFSFARSRCALASWCLRDGKQHVRLMEGMKKQFKHLRAAWTALNHRVHGEDELTQAKLKLRLAAPWETKQRPNILALSAPVKTETVHLVPAAELPLMMTELADHRDAALSDFRKKRGRLLYLQNLEKDRHATPDPCPICRNALEQQWAVLCCGHCICIECLQMMLPAAGATRRTKCPVCRELSDSADISFVDLSDSANASDIEVLGDFSTKVDGIVREVLRLLKEDPLVKILIFSTWAEVLKILGQALTVNHVRFLAVTGGKYEVVPKFKDADSGVAVLLLPLAWGSKGLNLVEATHVFLVEPILNPSEELQAIGRVHRIGQMRPTVVHRFIVKGTVEEKIFSVVSEAKDTWTKKAATLADLQKLFVISSRQSGREVPQL